MTVRLRLPELLRARGLTAYRLGRACEGAISPSMVYRLVRQRGAFRCLSPEQIDILCEVLEVEPGELIVREKKGKR